MAKSKKEIINDIGNVGVMSKYYEYDENYVGCQ